MLPISADAPAGYYDSAEGLSGEALKAALNDIIDNHIVFPYTSDSTDVWDILKESDRDPDNSDNIILLYTGWSINADQEYNGGSGWNREHVWAKSHGNFGTAMGPGTDTHHLRPTDPDVNNSRGHLDFDNGGTQHSVATGCYYDGDSWEPRDEVKGDVARIIFYMSTRYEGEHGELDLEVVDYVNTYPDPEHGKLSTLLEWNIQDPPDVFEMNRNDVVYSYQDNRNPFIDHPEYVAYIWGGDVPNDEQPPLITGVDILSESSILVNFSETIDPVSAQTESNYSISNSVGYPTLADITADGNSNTVTLTILPLMLNQSYTLTVNNVEDMNDNVIVANSTIDFTYAVSSDILYLDFEDDDEGCLVYDEASDFNWTRTDDTGSAHPDDVSDGDWYFYMNNYNGDEPADDWLILPAVTASRFSNMSLSFEAWNKYEDTSGYGLNLKYSQNYTSGDPYVADWTELDFSYSGDDEWETIDDVDLSNLTGEDFTLAFHYTSSGTTAGATKAWAVDKIYLTGSGETGLNSPSNLRISITDNQINLMWDEVLNATQYHIYKSDDPDKNFSLWEKVETVEAVTQWTDNNPVSKCFYRVTAE